jgi:hypothetical protein
MGEFFTVDVFTNGVVVVGALGFSFGISSFADIEKIKYLVNKAKFAVAVAST